MRSNLVNLTLENKKKIYIKTYPAFNAIFSALKILAMNMFQAFIDLIIILPINNIILKKNWMIFTGYNIWTEFLYVFTELLYLKRKNWRITSTSVSFERLLLINLCSCWSHERNLIQTVLTSLKNYRNRLCCWSSWTTSFHCLCGLPWGCLTNRTSMRMTLVVLSSGRRSSICLGGTFWMLLVRRGDTSV